VTYVLKVIIVINGIAAQYARCWLVRSRV